jgi:hypothetical protein
VILYELLTGKRLFEGDDLTDTLASVVKVEPDLSAAPPPEVYRFQISAPPEPFPSPPHHNQQE